VLGTVNPVALPYFAFTVPEPVGVVAVIAPDEPCLAGLLELLLPVLAGGNVAVAAVSEAHPLASLDLAEVLATSDVPGGVVNLLSGRRAELALALAAHDDVDAVLDGGGDAGLAGELARAAAQSITRYRTPAEPLTLEAVARTLELKTAWHPVGA
jgi:acyl-CoA reductase-like NAD-dependent aldehyde dehydrogenase